QPGQAGFFFLLKYSRLTEEEKRWLTRIAQKSELAKGPVPQRGKKR
ncbi:MAG: transcriptional regulator, partial [Bacillota bacterium]